MKDYSKKRSAFGKVIANHPLHMRTVANMEVGGLMLVQDGRFLKIHFD